MPDKLDTPKHVAIVMDGNRRWAKAKGLSTFEGHRRGEERIEPIVDTAIELGIPYLTFWAFSTENWNRTAKEVAFLMQLYRHVLHKKVDKFHKKNVKINIIGNLAMFPKDIQRKTGQWMEKTKNNKKITVNIALSYGGRDEILRAVEKWRSSPKFNPPAGGQSFPPQRDPASGGTKLTAEQFSSYLDTAGQPDPDLLIRTGDAQRLSGFLLWQIAYTELYFTKTLWPDFTPEKFKEALKEYKLRQRRFGK